MLLAVRASNTHAIMWLAANGGANVSICDLEDEGGGSVLHAAARNHRVTSIYVGLWSVYDTGNYHGFRGIDARLAAVDSLEAVIRKRDASKRSFLHVLAQHGSVADVDFVLSLFRHKLSTVQGSKKHFVDNNEYSVWHRMMTVIPSPSDPLAENGSRAVHIFDWLDDQGRTARDVAAALGRGDVAQLFEERSTEFRMATMVYELRHGSRSRRPEDTRTTLQVLQDLCGTYGWDQDTCLTIAKRTPWVSPELVFDYVAVKICSKYYPDGRAAVGVLKWLAANWGLDYSPAVRVMSTYCPNHGNRGHESCTNIETTLLWRIIHSDPFSKKSARHAQENGARVFKAHQDLACQSWMCDDSDPECTATAELLRVWHAVHGEASANQAGMAVWGTSNQTEGAKDMSWAWFRLSQRLEALGAEWFAEERHGVCPQKGSNSETFGRDFNVEKYAKEYLLHFNAEKVVLQYLMNDCGHPPPKLVDLVRFERWSQLVFFVENGHVDLKGTHSELHDFVTSRDLFNDWPCWDSTSATTTNVLAWHAALEGHTFILAWLLTQGKIAPALRSDGDALAVLHLAAVAGHCDTVFLLIHAGYFDRQLLSPGGLNICHIVAQQGTNLLFVQTLLERWQVDPLDAKGRHVWAYALETGSPEFVSWVEVDRAEKAALAAIQRLGELTFMQTFGSREVHIEALTRCISVSECFSEDVLKRIPDGFALFPPQPENAAPITGRDTYLTSPLTHAWACDGAGQPRYVYDIIREFLRLGYTELALRMYNEFVAKALERSPKWQRPDKMFQIALQDLAATAAESGLVEAAAHFQALCDAKTTLLTTSKGDADARNQLLRVANEKLAVAFREGADLESLATAWDDCVSANLHAAQSSSKVPAGGQQLFKYPSCLVTTDRKLFHDEMESYDWMCHHFGSGKGMASPSHDIRISPLSYLAQQGFLNIVQWILATGKISSSAQMYHAIEHGARAGNTAVVAMLLGHECCLEKGHDHSNRVLVALMAAVHERKSSTVKLLFRHLTSRGFDLNTAVDSSMNGCGVLAHRMPESRSVVRTAAAATISRYDPLLRSGSHEVALDKMDPAVLEEMATKAIRIYEESVRLFKWILAQPEIQTPPTAADNDFAAELLTIQTHTDARRPHAVKKHIAGNNPGLWAALVRAWDEHRVTMLRLSLEHGVWDVAKWAADAPGKGNQIHEPIDDSYAGFLRFMVRTCHRRCECFASPRSVGFSVDLATLHETCVYDRAITSPAYAGP